MSERSSSIDIAWQTANESNLVFDDIKAVDSHLIQIQALGHAVISNLPAYEEARSSLINQRQIAVNEFDTLTSMAGHVMSTPHSPFAEVEPMPEESDPFDFVPWSEDSEPWFVSGEETDLTEEVAPSSQDPEQELDEPFRLALTDKVLWNARMNTSLKGYSTRDLLAMGKKAVAKKDGVGKRAIDAIAETIHRMDPSIEWKEEPQLSDIAHMYPTLDRVPAECVRSTAFASKNTSADRKSVQDILLMSPRELARLLGKWVQEDRYSYNLVLKPNPEAAMQAYNDAQKFAKDFLAEQAKLHNTSG